MYLVVVSSFGVWSGGLLSVTFNVVLALIINEITKGD